MIDILLSTFNGEAFLHEQIDSLLGQTCTDWRLLARDDGSSDRSALILKEYEEQHPQRIHVVDTDAQNRGFVRSYATLLEMSEAPYVMFCDQDDIWLPQKIELSFSTIRHCESMWPETAILVHTDLVAVNEDGEPTSSSVWQMERKVPDLHTGDARWLAVVPVVNGNTFIMNRLAKDVSLPIDSRCRYHDLWVALRVKLCGGVVVSFPVPTILYRRYQGTASSSARVASVLASLRNLLDPRCFRSWKTEHTRARLAGLEISMIEFLLFKIRHLTSRYLFRARVLPRCDVMSAVNDQLASRRSDPLENRTDAR